MNRNLFSAAILSLVFVSSALLLHSCQKLTPSSPQPDEVMNGTVDGLTANQKRLFIKGDEEFHEVYTEATGLGPIFVASSCVGCHSGDNRGHPFTILTRFGQSDTTGNTFMNQGAPQLQQNAIVGRKGETLPAGATSSKFIAPIAAGMGFLELVSDQDLLSMSDPDDLDGDGISGRPHWNSIPSWVMPFSNAISQNGKYITRFGRKAGAYNLHQQAVGAFNNDIGITTSYMPNNPMNHEEGLNLVSTSAFDIDDESVNATVFYLRSLQAPIQRKKTDAELVSGSAVFKQLGCDKCHKETLRTGSSDISGLSNVNFHPYTDLLLHDMGEGLNDKYTEGSALASEWRTTPLWGLGLAGESQGGNYFLMHDGRARSIEEAIEYHGGEASQSKSKYVLLSESEKKALISFLKSL